MRVLLADGDQDVRGALRLLLTHDLGMQVVAEAADVSELRARVQAAEPDLLLLDWALAGGPAGAALADVRRLAPRLWIVVLSAHPEARPQALAAGADAFVSKADAPAQLLTTLRALPAPGDAPAAVEAPERGNL